MGQYQPIEVEIAATTITAVTALAASSSLRIRPQCVDAAVVSCSY